MLWSILFFSLIVLSNTQQVILKGMNTSQSSLYTDAGVDYNSSRAIDQNRTTCAHTLKMSKSWWTIDLLGVYRISHVRIYNGGNSGDMKGAAIYIGNSRMKNGTTNHMYEQITDFTRDQLNYLNSSTNVSGRYVTVFLSKLHFLILCEVEINGTIQKSPFKLIKKNKTWEEALYYCQNKNMDLASIVDEETQAWAELEAMKADTRFVWLGLRYTCTLEFWFWVDDKRLEFKHWAPNNKKEDCNMSAVIDKEGEHLWSTKSDLEMFNFICAN